MEPIRFGSPRLDDSSQIIAESRGLQAEFQLSLERMREAIRAAQSRLDAALAHPPRSQPLAPATEGGA